MAYDLVSGLKLLFCGQVGEGRPPINATWGYDYAANTWQKLNAA